MKSRCFLVIAAIFILAALNVQAREYGSFVANGEMARQRGEYSAAFENFDKALEWARGDGDRSKQAQVHNLIGQVHYLQAEYGPAIRAFRRADRLAVAAGDKREEARSWAFLGQLYWRVGKVEDGEMLLKDALEVFERTNDEIDIALTLRFIGRLEDGRSVAPRLDGDSSTGDLVKSKVALDLYERSLAISRKVGDEEGELTTLKEIGLTYQSRINEVKQLEKAMSYLGPLRERLKGSNYRRLYAVVLNNIANNQYVAKDLGGSLETADEAAAIFREIGDRQELREMLIRKVEIFIKLGDLAEALPVVDESIAIADELYAQPIGDELDRSRYFESLIDSYRSKLGILDRLKRPGEMFETFEAMRSLALRDLMFRPKEREKAPLTTDETAEEKRLNSELNVINRQIAQIRQNDKPATARLAALNRQLQKARLAKEEWQANIATKNRSLVRSSRPKSLDLAQMCSLLPDSDTAFVEFDSVTNQLGYVFVLTKTDKAIDPSDQENEPQIKNFVTEKITHKDSSICKLNVFANRRLWDESADYMKWAAGMTNRIKEFREQLARNSPSYKENARSIYDALLADGSSLLKGKKHLVIIPSGAVSDLPFQALIDKKGRFLIEDFSISYAPSLSVLAEMQANRKRLETQTYAGDLLAFGNPKLSAEAVSKQRSRYRGGKLESLPEAEAEVNSIGGFYPSKRIFIGKAATEENWHREAPKYRFLHLATHGLSDGEKPLYSHVLLSSDDDDDGLIEGGEITDTPLYAEMVVLSACETGRGREIDGEGMVGLAWAFAAAGVPSVVASSWKVESKVTADFMVDFYTDLVRSSAPSKARSLQNAALARIKNPSTRHPFYWAAFSLNGSW